MALTTVSVTGFITLPDGSDATNAVVTFSLSAPDYDNVSNYAVPKSDVSVSLGTGGALSVDLWPNDRGNKSTHYSMTITWVGGDSKARQSKFDGIQPTSSGSNDITDLLAVGDVDLDSVTVAIIPEGDLQAVLDAVATVNLVEGYKEDAAESALEAQGYASDALTHSNTALTAAQVAGTPLYPDITTALASVSEGDSFMVSDAGGLVSYTKTSGVAANAKRIGEVIFDTVADLLASTVTTLQAGLVIRTRTEGFIYEVVASGGHVTTAGGIGLKVSKSVSGFDVRAFGADPTGTTDSTTAIQNAIDYASVSEDNQGNVWFVGTFLCNDGLRLKRGVSLRGNWFNSTSDNDYISRIKFDNLSATAKNAALTLDKTVDGTQLVQFSGLSIVTTSSNGGWDYQVYNKETHWHQIDRCYFSGTVNNAAIWWGAVLYPQINDCIFSVSGGDVFIDGRESNYDITYYGVNWGMIQRNSFFGSMDGFWGNGLITLRDNNFERSNPDRALNVIKIVGGSAIGLTAVNNYVEWGGTYQHKFVYAESGQGNAILRDNYAPMPSTSVWADMAGRAVSVEMSGNYVGKVGRVIDLPTSGASVNMGANYTYGTDTLKPVQWWSGGAPNWESTSVTSAKNGPRVLQSENTIVRSQFIEYTVWQYGSASTAFYLGRGDNIQVQVTGTMSNLQDAGLYPGARVYIHARVAFDLLHNEPVGVFGGIISNGGAGYTTATVTFTGGGGSGAEATAEIRDGVISRIVMTSVGSGYTSAPTLTISGDGSGATAIAVRQAPFVLSSGSDKTIPSGTVIPFVVDTDRRLLEVGNLTSTL